MNKNRVEVSLTLNFTSVSSYLSVSPPLFVFFLFSLHSEGQRREEAVWFRLHSSDEGGRDHAVRREPWTLRLQGQTWSLSHRCAVSPLCCRLLRLSPRVRTPSVLQNPGKSASAENIQTHNSFSRRAFKWTVCKTSRESVYGAEFTDLITKNKSNWTDIFFPAAIWKIITESKSRDDIKPSWYRNM